MLRKLHPILLLLPLLCVLPKLQLSAQQLLPNTWVSNGPVNAITRQGDIVYVGGAFTHVGLPIAQGAIFDRNSGEALPPAASLVEDVTHSISDGQGGFFLTTLYSHTPGLNYRSVVHLLANGRISETFNPVIPSTTNNVKVLAATNDRVIIRTQYGNPYVYAVYCVGYDGSIYWSRTANGRIMEGIENNGVFYVVGNFTKFEGQARQRAAAIDIQTGQLLSWNTGSLIPAISDPAAATTVSKQKQVSLGISNNELFIRWNSSAVANGYGSIITSVNLVTGLPTGWTLPIPYSGSSNPLPMVVYNDRIYLSTSTDQGLLILDAVTKQLLPTPAGIVVTSPANPSNRIRSITAFDNTIYLAGGNKVDENGSALSDIVAFNATTLEREDININLLRDSNLSNPSLIHTMSVSGNRLFVGGRFPGINAQPRNNLYAFNVVTGELSTLSANFAEEESVTHLFATPTRLYASGFFVNVNDQERAAGLASFDLTSGLLNDWNPNLGGAWGSVFGDADRIYVYGDFSIVDGVNRAGLAAFNSSSGSILDWAPQDHLLVTAITANETDVYVSGRSADGTTNTIFAYNKNSGMTSFPAIEYSGGDGANAVRTMAANANHLYVGGDFNTLTRGTNNFNRLYFASINTASGQVEDLTIEVGPDPISFGNAFVSALAVTDGTVYLGGYFNGINGAPRHSLAALSTETGELTDWKFSSVNLVSDVVTGRSIRNLTVFEDGVFVGGQFDVINNFFRISNFLRASPDRSNVVTGTVFYDNNQNGVQDAGEDGVPNLLMELQPGNIFYPTDANGNYTVYTGIGNYTLRPVHPTYAINVTPNERQLSFVDDLQTSANNNFAIAIIPSITDMGITLTTDQNLRPGFYFNYAVTFTNHGTVPSSGSAQLTYDSRLLYQSSSIAPASIVGNVLTYNFTDVEPGQSQIILVNMRVPVPTIEGSLMGEEVISSASVSTLSADQNNNNNEITLPQTVVGSVDPNDKLVTPQGHGPNGYVAVDTDHLEYTIRFQNVGTAPATFVTLEDVIDPNLNISTFTVVSASHAYTYQIVDRTLSVLFDNINLIDSLTDEPNSHGYFTFTIGLNDNLPVGTQIQNTASIIFDYNLPLETNTVTNTLRNPPYETTVFLPDSTGIRNTEMLMPIFVNDWNDVLGAQFSVAWDNAVATFVGVESFGLPGMDLSSFNLSNAADGYFSFAWSDPTITAQSLPDTTALFYIRFNLTGDFGSTTPVAITHYPVAIEVISEDYENMEVIRIDGILNISSDITIQGTVRYSNNEEVQNVTIELSGASDLETATNAEGHYSLTFEPAEDEEGIVITPSKGSDPNLLNGIDVQDVASIRRHILRTELLTTAYQVIAANVSNNGVISIQDVILLQALILGVETDFPSGIQWTFVDAAHVFANALSPFPYPQTVEVDLATLTAEDNFNFTAVKIGDVTMDRDNLQAGRTKGQEVVLEISAPEKKDDGTYEVSITTLGFVDVSAYQFTVVWDAAKLEFINVVNEGTQGVYGDHRVSEGLLTTVWDEANGTTLSLDDQAQLFKLRFSALTDSDPGLVDITSQLTAMRMFDNKLNRVEFSVHQATEENKASGSFYPNPFDEQINISFTLKEAQSVKIEILNDLGQKIGEIENFYEKGWNEVKIDGSNFRKGLYLFTINIGGRRGVSKLIKK